MNLDSDEKLMEGCARGRSESFEILVQRHQRRVLHLIYRFLGNVTDSEDLSQDVFLRLFHSAKKYRPEAKFTTWLYRVVSNHCLNFKKKKRPKVSDELEQYPTRQLSPDQQLLQKEKSKEISLAVQSLPENQRMAILLSRFEGLSYREISHVMGTSLASVESLHQRGYQTLRKILSAGQSRLRC